MHSGLLILVVIMTILVQLSQGAGSPRKPLVKMKDLLLREYRSDFRPVLDIDTKIQVYVTWHPLSLEGFDEVAGSFSVVSGFFLFWYDQYLVWTQKYPIELLIKRDEIWSPRFMVQNAVDDSRFDQTQNKNDLVRVYKDGEVTYRPSNQMIQTLCSPTMTYFPVDEHTCSQVIIIKDFYPYEIKFADGPSLVLDNFQSSSIWEVRLVNLTTGQTAKKSGLAFSDITLNVTFRRKPAYILLNMIAPMLLLSIINVLVFVLPVDSGERVSYSVTMFLSLAVYMTIIADKLPDGNPVPLFTYFLAAKLTYSAVIILCTIVGLQLHLGEFAMLTKILLILSKGIKRIKHASRCLPNRRQRVAPFPEPPFSDRCPTISTSQRSSPDSDSAERDQSYNDTIPELLPADENPIEKVDDNNENDDSICSIKGKIEIQDVTKCSVQVDKNDSSGENEKGKCSSVGTEESSFNDTEVFFTRKGKVYSSDSSQYKNEIYISNLDIMSAETPGQTGQERPSNETETALIQNETSDEMETALTQDETSDETKTALTQDDTSDEMETALTQDETSNETKTALTQDDTSDKLQTFTMDMTAFSGAKQDEIGLIDEEIEDPKSEFLSTNDNYRPQHEDTEGVTVTQTKNMILERNNHFRESTQSNNECCIDVSVEHEMSERVSVQDDFKSEVMNVEMEKHLETQDTGITPGETGRKQEIEITDMSYYGSNKGLNLPANGSDQNEEDTQSEGGSPETTDEKTAANVFDRICVVFFTLAVISEISVWVKLTWYS